MEPMEKSPARGAARTGSVLALGWVFLRIGALAFGGLGAALALVERELVDKRPWLTPADLTEALTYTKLLPSSTVVQVMAYLGYTLGGWPGSALATAAFVLPSVLVMLVLAALYVTATAVPTLGPAVTGLTAAVVGVLLATTYRLGKANIKGPVALGMAVAACGVGVWLGVNAALIVVAAGVLGILLFATEPTMTQQAKECGA